MGITTKTTGTGTTSIYYGKMKKWEKILTLSLVLSVTPFPVLYFVTIFHFPIIYRSRIFSLYTLSYILYKASEFEQYFGNCL